MTARTLEEVLAAHQQVGKVGPCLCGWGPTRWPEERLRQHRAHVAEALREWMGERLDAARPDVATVICGGHLGDANRWHALACGGFATAMLDVARHVLTTPQEARSGDLAGERGAGGQGDGREDDGPQNGGNDHGTTDRSTT